MNSMSQLPQQAEISHTNTSIVRGRQDFISVLLRSTGGELYKLRRRLMSKILLLIAVLMMLVTFAFLAVGALLTSKTQSPAPLSSTLILPASLTTAVGMVNFTGLILLVILAGTLVGGEYGIGTVRLLLTRGPTRTQFVLAKTLAILACVLLAFLVLIPIGILLGALFGLLLGAKFDFTFFSAEWLLHALLYILASAFGIFVYTMLASLLATLGKASAAGIAGALIWWFVESVLGTILPIVGNAIPGAGGAFLKSIPDYFISNNIQALLNNQDQYLTGTRNAASSQATATLGLHTLSDGHALLVLFVYLVVFVGLTWWITQKRDITN